MINKRILSTFLTLLLDYEMFDLCSALKREQAHRLRV